MTKPSKKTEWEEKVKKDMRIRNSLLNLYLDEVYLGRKIMEGVGYVPHPDKLVQNVLSLLHQRDNEIREWAAKNKEDEDKYADPDRKTISISRLFFKGYNQALDDLLTYLSNREV